MGLVVVLFCSVFLVKQKTAYEMRISDWSADVCSSDLPRVHRKPSTIWWRRRLSSASARPASVRNTPRYGRCTINPSSASRFSDFATVEIGRASWRASVWQYGEISVVYCSLQKKLY